MGVVYKISPDITDFILDYKKAHPEVSCRSLSIAVKEKFGKEISKSSINAIIKEANLSSKIGRKSFKVKPKLAAVETKPQVKPPEPAIKQKINANGLYFLKVADLALGGSESLLCRQLLQEVHSYRVTLEDNTVFFIDGEFRSVWPTANISREFSVNINLARMHLKEISKDSAVLILLTAPPYPAQLINLLLWTKSASKKMALMGEGSQVLLTSEESIKSRRFIFGLLPHQYERDIRIISSTQAANFLFKLTDEEFNIADYEVEINIPSATKLRMLSLKKAYSAQPLINLCTNIPSQEINSPEIARLYLEHWPEPIFSFSDLDEKNELLAYALERELPIYPTAPFPQWENISDFWRLSLHTYCVRHFFPLGYEKLDFTLIKQRFYDLPVEIEDNPDYYLVRFILPTGYAFQKDLQYAIKRVNESRLTDVGGRRFWFTL